MGFGFVRGKNIEILAKPYEEGGFDMQIRAYVAVWIPI